MTRINLKKHEKKVRVRRLRDEDYEVVRGLQQKVFKDISPWSRAHFESQLRTFPAGQIGVEIAGSLVAISSSLIVDGRVAKSAHDFGDIADNGFVRNHTAKGDYLYGIDIAVDPDFQGRKLARRLYDARKELVRARNLKGMIIGGRIPGYHKHAKDLTAEEYADHVQTHRIFDPVMTAQLSNGFQFLGILDAYLPEDEESRGFATLMEWTNPDHRPASERDSATQTARICIVQYQMRTIRNFADFAQQVEYFVDTASDYRADFVVFPELLTTQLLCLIKTKRPDKAARKLDRYTVDYLDLFTDLAIRYNVNIVGGSHLVVEDDLLFNIGYLFRRDGTIGKQYKLHITPDEVDWWGVSPGDRVQVFDTDRGRVAISICYDIEFPELARVAAEKGAQILFVPYNTDMREGHLRVRYCCQARCIENHVYVCTAGAIGNLPKVDAADIHYAQSAIYTPSDFSFDRDGIAAECEANTEMVLIHDLNLDALRVHKQAGTVRNWLDRRRDIYHLEIRDGKTILKI